MRTFVMLVLLACSPMLPAAVAGGSAPGGEVSVVPGFLTEAELLASLGSASFTNCFAGTVRVSADLCTKATPIGPIIHPCIRVNMNVPMAYLEGGDRQGHLSLFTAAGAIHMASLNAGCSPSEKTMDQRVGDMVSASCTSQGRCLNMLLLGSAIKTLINALTLGQLCTPTFELTRIPYGYAFASEGDHINGTEFGNWRGAISYYWFVPWLTPFTAVSRITETAGLCPVDYFRVFCHGGWGTVYPATGTNPIESRTTNFVDSMWDSLTPTFAPFYYYGPMHLRLGTALHAAAHNPKSYALGATAQYAMLGRNGYVQPLYPIRQNTCYHMADPGEDFIPTNTGTMPGVSSKPIAETNNALSTDQNRVSSLLTWPRFTCCNLCIGAIETAERSGEVGRGFLPQLIP